MPQVTLTFNLPDDEESFKDALRGTDYSILLGEIDDALRTITKYDAPQALNDLKDENDKFEVCLQTVHLVRLLIGKLTRERLDD